MSTKNKRYQGIRKPKGVAEQAYYERVGKLAAFFGRFSKRSESDRRRAANWLLRKLRIA